MTILPLLYTRRLKHAHTSLEKYDTVPILLVGWFYKLRRSKLTLHTTTATTTTMARISLVILCTAMAAMLFQGGMGVTITVVNQCPYTVWAAASPGGGSQLQRGQTWAFQVAGDTTGGRVWGRTGCNFDASGKGPCQTGDCGGVLQCQGYGQPSATLAEYGLNKFNNLDFYDISLVDGFNVPMSFAALKGGCTNINCNKDVLSACPADLKAPNFCKNGCVAFNKPEFCCTGSAENNCGPNQYSKFFKGQCPQAYSYAKDDATSVFTCPAGGDYKVVFCG